MNDMNTPEKSPWGWKALIISIILSCFFLGFFYLAINNEPDYMPSQKDMESHQTAFKKSPVMSKQDLEQAAQNKAAASNDPIQPMSNADMQHMQNTQNQPEHSH